MQPLPFGDFLRTTKSSQFTFTSALNSGTPLTISHIYIICSEDNCLLKEVPRHLKDDYIVQSHKINLLYPTLMCFDYINVNLLSMIMSQIRYFFLVETKYVTKLINEYDINPLDSTSACSLSPSLHILCFLFDFSFFSDFIYSLGLTGFPSNACIYGCLDGAQVSRL